MCYDWPVKNTIVSLPIRLKGISKHIGIGSPEYWHGYTDNQTYSVGFKYNYIDYQFQSKLIFKSSKIHKIHFLYLR